MALLDFLNGLFGGGGDASGLLASAPALYNPNIGLQAMFAGGQTPNPPSAAVGGTSPVNGGGNLDPLTGATAGQQKWMDALGGVSAALRDAGAYLQHQPEAAGNVAAFNAQRQQRLQQQQMAGIYAGLLPQLVGQQAPPGQMFATPGSTSGPGDNGVPLAHFDPTTGGSLPQAQANTLAPILNSLGPQIGLPIALQMIQKQLEPQAPIKLSEGDTLINPQTFQPLYSAAPAADFQEKNYGINPATGKLDTYVIDRRTGRTQWLNIPPRPDIDIVNNQVIDKNAVTPGTVIPPAAPVLLTPDQIAQQVSLAGQRAAVEEAARNGAVGARFAEPKVVEADDGQGGKIQVLGQQDKQTGQWVTADQNRTPLANVNLPATTPQGRVAGQIVRITTGAHDIASELENIVRLGTGASAGFLPRAGAMGTPLGALARSVTSQEVQSYRTAGVGLSRALASLEAAGLAPPGSLTQQMDGLQLAQGDTQLTKLQKIGSMAQQSTNAMDAILASPLLTDKQRAEVQGLKDRVQKAVPWTPADVIDLINAGNPQLSLAQMAQRRLGTGATSVTVTGKGAATGQWGVSPASAQ